LPEDLKQLYRTKWEIDQNALVLMAADRAPFIDQSQAFSLNMVKANEEIISKMHLSTWKMVLLVFLIHYKENYYMYYLMIFRA